MSRTSFLSVGTLAWGAVVVTLILFPGAPRLRADVFELKDGRRIEGTIVREFDTLIAIKTDGGVVTIDVADIVKREKTDTKYDDYLERRKKLETDDAAGHLELARWCIQEELIKESIFHFKQVLRADPNQAEARDALGYERVDGEWFIKGSPEAEQRKRGEVDPDVEPVAEMPEDVDVSSLTKLLQGERPAGSAPSAGRTPTSTPARSLGGTSVVLLEIREKVGKGPPEVSAATHLVRQLLREMDQPLRLQAGDGAGDYRMTIDIRVRYERQNMFYNVPVANIYRGTAEVKMFETGGAKKRVLHTRVKCPFSAVVRLDRKKALVYAYHYTVRKLLHRLSREKFLKARGVKPEADPDSG